MKTKGIFSEYDPQQSLKTPGTKISVPFGVSNFEEIRKESLYYVDKTLLIENLIESTTKVTLFTRPRRFGKTLTMSMLQSFFDIQRVSRKLFEGLKISKNSEICDEYMNQYPTIFITLRGIEGFDFVYAFKNFQLAVSDMCQKHTVLLESSNLTDKDKELFSRLCEAGADEFETASALKTLIRLLYLHYGKPVIVLIDEYDVPLAKASGTDFYDRMLFDIRNFMSPLKDNDYLKFAVITGCLRVSKESIFTGTNNFYVNSITSNSFGEYFGFTDAEVKELLKRAGALTRYADVKDWYDGYNSNGIDLYCPWDVIHYVRDFLDGARDIPKCYWVNTSDDNIIRTFIDNYGEIIQNDFEKLVRGGVIQKHIKENLTYDLINSSENNFWSILLMTGYLTSVEPDNSEGYEFRNEIKLRIPNREILQIYKDTLKDFFDDSVRYMQSDLEAALWNGDTGRLTEILNQILLTTISFHDYNENFYHAFLLGILTGLGYDPVSNLENGEGRSDIVVKSKRDYKISILELKHSETMPDLTKDCDKALQQIRDRKYYAAYEKEFNDILCYGIAFYKKRCMVKMSDISQMD